MILDPYNLYLLFKHIVKTIQPFENSTEANINVSIIWRPEPTFCLCQKNFQNSNKHVYSILNLQHTTVMDRKTVEKELWFKTPSIPNQSTQMCLSNYRHNVSIWQNQHRKTAFHQKKRTIRWLSFEKPGS